MYFIIRAFIILCHLLLNLLQFIRVLSKLWGLEQDTELQTGSTFASWSELRIQSNDIAQYRYSSIYDHKGACPLWLQAVTVVKRDCLP